MKEKEENIEMISRIESIAQKKSSEEFVVRMIEVVENFRTREQQDFEYDRGLYDEDIEVNRRYYEEKEFPLTGYEKKDLTRASDYYDVLMGRDASDEEALKCFYVEKDGKKQNIWEMCEAAETQEEKDNHFTSYYVKAYFLHAITQKNLKVSFQAGPEKEIVFNTVSRSPEEIRVFNNNINYHEGRALGLQKTYNNFAYKYSDVRFPDENGIIDLNKVKDSDFNKANDIYDDSFSKLINVVEDNAYDPYEELIVYGVKGYQDGISVAKLAQLSLDEAKNKNKNYSTYRESSVPKMILAQVASSPDLEIAYIPESVRLDRDPKRQKMDPTKSAIYIGGKYGGIKTGTAIEEERKLEAAIEQNKGIDNILTRINDENHREIHDIYLNNNESFEVNTYLGENYPPVLSLDQNFKSKDIKNAAEVFDEVFKDAIKEDPDFIDHFDICPQNTKPQEKYNINSICDKWIEKGRNSKRISGDTKDALAGDRTDLKKALLMHAMANSSNSDLYYRKGDYVKKINVPEKSPLRIAQKNLRNMGKDFKRMVNENASYEAAINSKDRYNKRLIPEEMTKEEFAEVDKTFDKIFEKFQKKYKLSSEELLSKLAFRADTDLEFENALSYVDQVHMIDNLTPEQRTQYAKAYIVHAAGDPRERIAFAADLINPETKEIMKDVPERERLIESWGSNVPKAYKDAPKENVKNNKKGKKVDVESLLNEGLKRNQELAEQDRRTELQIESFQEAQKAMELVKNLDDTLAKGIKINAGDKAGKIMTTEELLALTEEELAEAEKAFDETFKDLIKYDEDMKSFRFRNEKTNYKSWNDIFVGSIHVGNKSEEQRRELVSGLQKKNGTIDLSDDMSDFNKTTERYWKAHVMRALTAKDVNLSINPLMREATGLKSVYRYDSYVKPYLKEYFDLNHPKEPVIPQLRETVKRTSVEAREDKRENIELEKLHEKKLFRNDAEEAGIARRPFQDNADAKMNEIEESLEEVLDDEQWEERQEMLKLAEEKKELQRKEEEERRIQKEKEELEYDLSHDEFGNELPPKEVEFNRREYEIHHANLTNEEYYEELNKLNKEKENYEKEKLQAEQEENRKRQEEQKRAEEEKWNNPESLEVMRNNVTDDIRHIHSQMIQLEEKYKEQFKLENINKKINKGLKETYDNMKSSYDKLIAERKKIDEKFKSLGIDPEELSEKRRKLNKDMKDAVNPEMEMLDPINRIPKPPKAEPKAVPIIPVKKKAEDIINPDHVEELNAQEKIEELNAPKQDDKNEELNNENLNDDLNNENQNENPNDDIDDAQNEHQDQNENQNDIQNQQGNEQLQEEQGENQNEIQDENHNEEHNDDLDNENQNEELNVDLNNDQNEAQNEAQNLNQNLLHNQQNQQNQQHNIYEEPQLPADANQPEGPGNPNRVRLKKFVEGYSDYSSGLADMVGFLEIKKGKLISTQTDKNSNFGNEKKEGSGLYKKMTESLNDMINNMKNHEKTPDEVRTSMVNAYKAACNYYKSHYGFFGIKGTDKGTDRLGVSEDLVQKLPAFINAYDNMRVGVCYLTDQNNEAYGNRNLNSIKEKADSINQMLPLLSLEIDQPKSLQDRVAISEAQIKLRNSIRSFSNTMASKYEFTKPYDSLLSIKRNESIKDKAKYFVAKRELDKIFTPDVSRLEAESIQRNFNPKNFKKEYEKLAENPIFKACMTKYPDSGMSKWQKIEMKTSQKIHDFDSKLKKINLDTLPQRMNDKMFNGAEGNAENYQTLAETITYQILTNPKMRVLVNDMVVRTPERAGEKLNTMINSIKTSLENRNALTPKNNESYEQMVNRLLHDDSLKSKTLKDYQRDVARIRQNNANQRQTVNEMQV